VTNDGVSLTSLKGVADVVHQLNVGYLWMFTNCLTSAAYVSIASLSTQVTDDGFQVLTMRKRIKATGFSDWDSMFYNNLLSIPVLAVFSIIVEDWGIENLERNL
jgi:GDP-mannose transporter